MLMVVFFFFGFGAGLENKAQVKMRQIIASRGLKSKINTYVLTLLTSFTAFCQCKNHDTRVITGKSLGL